MVKYPSIHLAIDNCFAAKRWNTPSQWACIIKNAGFNYVELNADNDCDPLLMGDDYLKRWLNEVNESCAKHSVTVSSLHSGHGTYTTLGLGHPDESVRSILRDRWLKPMMDNAVALGAGFGFYCHAFNQQELYDKNLYDNAFERLCRELEQLVQYAADIKLPFLSLEQMYTPHQIPWTIKGCMSLIRRFSDGYPLHITLDTGHQSLQSRFLMPKGCEQLHPWLYAEAEDADYVQWFEKLACYSPIVHLQQCQKDKSPHWPFTDEYNAVGIIEPDRILSAIKRCYDNFRDNGTSLSVGDIYLTMEIFSPTAATPDEIIRNINDSAAYWRKFIPKDGMRIDELLY